MKDTETAGAVTPITFGKGRNPWKTGCVLTAVLLAILVVAVVVLVTVMVLGLDKDKTDGTQSGLAMETDNTQGTGSETDLPAEEVGGSMPVSRDNSMNEFTEPSGEYSVTWEFDNDTITFHITAHTLGWVGLGLSGTGGMIDADIMVAWVRGGQGYILDTYASRNGAPIVDSSQDWQLLSATEDAAVTQVSVKRWRNLCDVKDRNVTEGTIRLIWAMSDTDPAMDTSLDGDDYHGSTRGSFSRRLLEPAETIVMPDDLISIDILHEQVIVPTESTTYWCETIVLPKLDTKHHVVMIAPVIQEGHESFVHHVLLYACPPSSYTMADSAECYKFEARWKCETLIYGYAIGGMDYYLPEAAGIPYGGPGSIRTVMLETHYDNPRMESGLVDSSGFRFWLTKQLRSYDAGVIMAGQVVAWGQMIPPGMSNFVSVGHCTEDCLRQAMFDQPDGVHVYATALHTHLAGRTVRLRHVRGDTELKPIAEDLTYDFNYQSTRVLEQEITILPGDRLIVECGYDTTDRVNITWSGEATTDEMCLAFLFYYPMTWMTSCQTVPTEEQLAASVPNSTVEWAEHNGDWYLAFAEPDYLAGLPVGAALYHLAENSPYPDGSQEKVILDNLQELSKYGDIHEVCGGSYNDELTVPPVINTYIEPKPVDCKNGSD